MSYPGFLSLIPTVGTAFLGDNSVNRHPFDDIHSELDDVDIGHFGIEHNLNDMIQALSHRNRLTRRRFHIYDENPENKQRNRIRTKSLDTDT